IETGRKHEFLRRLATIRPKDGDTASPAFGYEYVAVRRSADNARPTQSRGEQIDRKARRYARRLVGAVHDAHHAGYRLRRLRGRQIGRPNKPTRSRRIRAPVAERRAAFEHGACGLRKKRRQKRCNDEAKRADKAQRLQSVSRTLHWV